MHQTSLYEWPGDKDDLSFQALTYMQAKKQSLLLVFETEDQALSVESRLMTLAPFFDIHPETRISQFPELGSDLYLGLAGLEKASRKRLRAFSMLSGQVPVILTTSIPGLFAKMPPLLEIDRRTLRLEAEETALTREVLRTHLASAGYQPLTKAEFPGTYSIRGDQMDICFGESGEGYRVRFFDEFVERIQVFDPRTQRTLHQRGELTKLSIPPVTALDIHGDTRRLRQKLREVADARAYSRRERDPLIERILQKTEWPQEVGLWTPWYFEETTTLAVAFQGSTWLTTMSKPNFSPHVDAFHRRIYPMLPAPEELFSVSPLPEPTAELKPMLRDLSLQGVNLGSVEEWLKKGEKVWLSVEAEVLSEELRQHFSGFESNLRICVTKNPLKAFQVENHKGLSSQALGIRTPTSGKPKAIEMQKELLEVGVDDIVVHHEHGLGRYRGLVKLKLQETETECIQIDFHKQDKLYLPVHRVELISRYSGPNPGQVLSVMGSERFLKTKEKVKASLQTLALDLIRMYAQRSVANGTPYFMDPTVLERFTQRFPYSETPDQWSACEAVRADLEAGKLLDRLICGDVGFGKTEVAMRAALQVLSTGDQVVLVAPTTLLVRQHEQTFRERFQDFPFKIESLSRLKSAKTQKETLELLQEGKVDLLIATHRVFSRDVAFKQLGLLIIDEEHQFGVEQKERLRAMKADTHTLSLSATPIPRTLSMAFSGLKDLSLLRTPPVHRKSVHTVLANFSWSLVVDVIEREYKRGGQVFFVTNRIESMQEDCKELQSRLPHLKIHFAHGQLQAKELESRMLSFVAGDIEVLVCTTIIESGLDIPKANTILIKDADQYGLAQLHQIRGRVGRSGTQAWAYLLVKDVHNLQEQAERRLLALKKFSDLGSGFRVASEDLEIRGAGDLLGASQSGNIESVGIELFSDLLAEAVHDLEQQPSRTPCEVQTHLTAFIPDSYLVDMNERLQVYRRLSLAPTESHLRDMELSMEDQFGPLPPQARSLMWVLRTKLLLTDAAITQIQTNEASITLTPSPSTPLKMTLLLGDVSAKKQTLLPNGRIRFPADLKDGGAEALYRATESWLHRFLDREAR